MAQSHDVCTALAHSPPEESPAERLPALPNSRAGDFASSPGEPEALAVLAGEPLGSFYYEALLSDPQNTAREALFTAYVHDAEGFTRLLCVTRAAARAELAAGSERAALLQSLPRELDLGLEAMRSHPAPFELDILLGQLDEDKVASTADFVEQVYGPTPSVLMAALMERAEDPQGVERLREALGMKEQGGLLADLADFALEKLAQNAGFAAQESSSQLFGLLDAPLDGVESDAFQEGRERANLFDKVRGAAETALGLTMLFEAGVVAGAGVAATALSGGALAVPAGGSVVAIDGVLVGVGSLLTLHGGATLMANQRRQSQKIRVESKISTSYAKKKAEDMSDQAQRDVDHLTKELQKGNPEAGIGSREIGDSFFELRGHNAGRVIVKKIHDTYYVIVGKFQGHVRGDAANSATIERLKRDDVE